MTFSPSQRESLKIYLNDVGSRKRLKDEQLLELARNGDAESRNQIAEANLRLVVSIAKRFKSFLEHHQLVDLIQEGNIGLLEASRRMDPERENKFSSYAIWWIRGAIINSFAGQGRSVKIPHKLVTTINRIRKLAKSCELQLGRHPNQQELVDFLVDHGMGSSEEVEDLLAIARMREESLDMELGDNSSGRFRDIVKDENSISEDDLLDRVFIFDEAHMLLPLQEVEKKVIRDRFLNGSEKTLKEIGDEMGVSRERIRQLEARAIEKLQTFHRRPEVWEKEEVDQD